MKKNMIKIGAVAAVFALGLTACGTSKSASISETGGVHYDSYTNNTDYRDYGMSAVAMDDGYYAEEEYYDEGAYEAEAAESTSASTTGSTGLNTIREKNEGAKLIRTVSLSINTEHFDDSVKVVEEKVASLGGYIANSELYDYSYGRTQSIVVRIPYDKVDLFLDGIDAYGTIGHKSDNTEDITLKYSDTQSRIESLETQHKRLLELLEQAEDLNDIIILNDHLTEVEWELDSYKKQIRNYDDLVSYSTISIDISEKEYVAPIEQKTIWGRIATGLANTMHGLGVFFSDLLVWLVVSSPVLLILAIIVVAIIFIIKGIVKSARKKRAKKAAAKEAAKVATEKVADASSKNETEQENEDTKETK